MRAWLSVIALVASSIVGCSATVRSGHLTVEKAYFEQAERELTDRAAVALGCMPEQVRFTVLTLKAEYPSRMLAEGAGHEIVYVRHYRRHLGALSQRNSDWSVERSSLREHPRGEASAL